MLKYLVLCLLFVSCNYYKRNDSKYYKDFCETAKKKGKKCILVSDYCQGNRFNYPCYINISDFYKTFDNKNCNLLKDSTDFNSNTNEPLCWLVGISPENIFYSEEEKKTYCISDDGVKCDVLRISIEFDTLKTPFIGGGVYYYYNTKNDSIYYGGKYIK